MSKETLLKLNDIHVHYGGVRALDGASVEVDEGEVVALMGPHGRRVFKHLTVRENLEVGGYVVKDKKLIEKRIEEVLELFPALKTKIKAKSGSLSGGQQQMLAIARGLMTDPKVLLLDEPSLGLAPKIVKEVFAKIKEINERRKTAIVVVEHNIKSILEIVKRA